MDSSRWVAAEIVLGGIQGVFDLERQEVTQCSFFFKSVEGRHKTYTHCSVNLSHRLFICRELVDLDSVADQLTHDFALEFMQLIFCNGISFGYNGNNVHLQWKQRILILHLCSYDGEKTRRDFWKSKGEIHK